MIVEPIPDIIPPPWAGACMGGACWTGGRGATGALLWGELDLPKLLDLPLLDELPPPKWKTRVKKQQIFGNHLLLGIFLSKFINNLLLITG